MEQLVGPLRLVTMKRVSEPSAVRWHPTGAEPINHKLVFCLMAQGQLLLQPHVGHRPIHAHEGSVITLASNQRWSSDGLEISCWNGEVVRIVFAIDTCDREIIG